MIWFLIYLVGIPLTAAVMGYVDPPVDTEEQLGTGMLMLIWPITAGVGLFLGALWLLGWIAGWIGRWVS